MAQTANNNHRQTHKRTAHPDNGDSEHSGKRRSSPNLSKSDYLAWISPNQIYEPDERGRPRLSARFLKWISQQPPPLTLPKQRLVALLNDRRAIAKVRAEAANIADREVLRNAKRIRVNSVIQQADRNLTRYEKQCKWYSTALRFISPKITRWERRSDSVFSLTMLPHLLALLFWSVFFVMTLVAELNNSIGLLMTAGMGFATSWLAALFSIFVVVAMPFVSLKFLDATLQEEGRRIFDALLSIISIPLSIVVIIFFSMTIGGSHSEVDMFAESNPWKPAYWVLYMFGMFGLAVTVLMIAKFLRKTLEHFYDVQTPSNPAFKAAEREVKELNAAIDDIHLDKSEAKRVIQELDNEREDFMDLCRDQFVQLRQQIAAARAQLMAKEISS